MCGIAGIISNKKLSYTRNEIDEILNLTNHRGPDSNGYYMQNNFALFHNRLSILDLSQNAKQPMKNGKIHMVFNGEIYNHLELRKRYLSDHSFKSSSDTETIIILYKKFGKTCFSWLNGMFSIAIVDENINRLILVRDRLGIKPLVYYNSKKEFMFSSEPKTIIKLSEEKFSLNKESVEFYFAFRQPAENKTFFENINQIEPGNIYELNLKSNKLTKTCYWNLKSCIHSNEIFDFETASKILYEELQGSVHKRLLSDVPIGSYLSGGVDSSIISYLMSKKKKEKINTYTIGFNELNEFSYAKILSQQINSNHYEYTLNSSEYYNSLEKLIEYKDAPLSVPNEIPLYLMSKKLKEHSTVVLSGEGADEIFGGYGRIFGLYRDIRNIKNKTIYNYYQNIVKKDEDLNFENIFYHKYRYVPLNFINDLTFFNLDDKNTKNFIISKLNSIKTNDLRVKTSYLFETFHLRGLLSRLDSSTMAASVEGRVPFVDHKLVELSFKIPFKYKIFEKGISTNSLSHNSSEKEDIPKYILKKLFEKKIDNTILYRKKIGFPVPLTEWFSTKNISQIQEVLLDNNSSEFVNKKNIEIFLNTRNFNYEKSYFVWMLYNLELFVKKYKL
jgi:asparagine synthase (glutamine-hydrolysing)